MSSAPDHIRRNPSEITCTSNKCFQQARARLVTAFADREVKWPFLEEKATEWFLFALHSLANLHWFRHEGFQLLRLHELVHRHLAAILAIAGAVIEVLLLGAELRLDALALRRVFHGGDAAHGLVP
jgi:hypothetical protein